MKTFVAIAAALSLAVSCAYAGTRNSADYSVAAEVSDAGGLHATSADYSTDDSIGGVTGISTVAAPQETANSGYLGQIYNVSNFTISAPQHTISQAGTLQLSATALLDDNTTLALNSTQVAWSVASGPINYITSDGLATAGNIRQTIIARVRGAFAGNTSAINLAVIAVPGMTETFDQWISLYMAPQQLGINSTPGQASAIPYSDGVPNLLKYLYDINPTAHLSTQDRAALPSLGFATVNGTEYLTLTYRQSSWISGLTINVQTTSDLTNWSTIAGSELLRQQVGVDANTGDPIMQVGVKATSPNQFIRLNVTRE